MRPAQIVEKLLETDEVDPKAFLARRADTAHSILLDKIREAGITPEIINGVEVYGMFDDGEMQERVEHGDPNTNKWGVSLHTTDQNLWMVDFDDYTTARDALENGQEVFRILKEMFPTNTIHFVDEISPA